METTMICQVILDKKNKSQHLTIGRTTNSKYARNSKTNSTSSSRRNGEFE